MSGKSSFKLLVVSLCILVDAASANAADVVTNGITLENAVGDWQVHQPTGRVFASLPTEEAVVEFASDGSQVRKIKVGSGPAELIIKRDKLIVGCTKTHTIDVIDLKTSRREGTIQLHGTGPYGLFCSDVDNGFAYAITDTGSGSADVVIFQVDIKTMKVRNQSDVRSWGQRHPCHVAMSRDGSWLVPDARGRSSPSGADLVKVNEDDFEFTQVRHHHASFGPIAAGPYNRHWTCGGSLYSLDLQRKLRTFAGDYMAVHPKLDLAASVSTSILHLQRFSDASTVSVMPLYRDGEKLENAAPNKANVPRATNVAFLMRTSKPSSFDPTIQFDLQHDLVFVGLEKAGYWVDLTTLEKKVEPLSILVAPSFASTEESQPLHLPLSHTNQSDRSLRIELGQAPDRARLDKVGLSWTPASEDVGIHTITLNLVDSKKNVKDTVEIRVRVERPQIDLGFKPRAMVISASGKRMVLWGPSPGQESRHPAHTGSDEVIVIDLGTREPLVKKTMPQGVRFSAIDDQYTYIAPSSGDLFYRLDHQLNQAKRMFVSSTPRSIHKVSKNLLAVDCESGVQLFDVQEMREVQSPGSSRFNRHVDRTVQRIDAEFTWVYDRLMRYSDAQVVQISNSQLPALTTESTNRFPRSVNYGRPMRGGWGRMFGGNQLFTSTGNLIKRFDSGANFLMSDVWPVLLSVQTESQQEITSTMQVLSLSDGSVLESSILDVRDNSNRSRSNPYRSGGHLATQGDSVYFMDGDRMLIASYPAVVKSVEQPLHFDLTQTTEVPADRVAKIKLQTSGPSKGLSFRLLQENRSVSIDEGSGLVTVQVPALWKSLTTELIDEYAKFGFSDRSDRPIHYPVNARQYLMATGKTLPQDQFAAKLPLWVSVSDGEGQSDELRFCIVVVGARAKIDVEIENRRKERETARAKAAMEAKEEIKRREMLRQQQVQAAAERAASRDGGRSEGTSERIKQLELRMRRMEATLDAILEKLDDQEE